MGVKVRCGQVPGSYYSHELLRLTSVVYFTGHEGPVATNVQAQLSKINAR